MQLAGATVALSDEQTDAIELTLSNLKRGIVAISGPAGSGKTTLIQRLTECLQQRKFSVIIAAMTNKAAFVLSTKGIAAVTFHQACMRPLFKPPLDKLGAFLDQKDIDDLTKVDYPKTLLEQYDKTTLELALNTARLSGLYAAFRQLGIKDVMKYVSGWLPAGKQTSNCVLIVDEASMLGQVELETAMEVFDTIILVGDENQLPPVKSEPVFWKVPTRATLTQIHRQAKGSQPLEIATCIRENKRVVVEPVESIRLELSRAGMPVIVWRNATRQDLTKDIRAKLGYDAKGPLPGESLICRNASDREAKNRGLINNTLWKVVESDGFYCTLENDQGDILEDVSVHIEELDRGSGIPFRFGYVLTAHNSQGSEWPTVMVHHPDAMAYWNFKKDKTDAKRWLYTAVTRAKQQVLWVNSRVI